MPNATKTGLAEGQDKPVAAAAPGPEEWDEGQIMDKEPLRLAQQPGALVNGNEQKIRREVEEGSYRGREDQAEPAPEHEWVVEAGQRPNYIAFGKALAQANANLYRSESGLVAVDAQRLRPIGTTKQFSAVIADSLTVRLTKDGEVKGDMIPAAHLGAMLAADVFLDAFRPVHTVARLPIYKPDYTLARGYDNGVLYLGPEPVIGRGTTKINEFLNVMPFASNADRTNAVGAALTGLLRTFWLGAKPVVLVTASKSHSGKGTVTEFFCGRVQKVSIHYGGGNDWPITVWLQRGLQATPEAGVVLLDNVRQDSSSRGGFIRSSILESLITSSEIRLSAPSADGTLIRPNQFVFTINSNDGTFSPDLLNRGLSIHLAPKGDLKDCPIGNPKDKWLPENRHLVEAELRGMIERWRLAGCHPDEHVAFHPMTEWAGVIGGILRLAGFADFLANYQVVRKLADPMKEALAILAAAKPGQPLRPGEWAKVVKNQGLVKALVGPNERDSEKGRERGIGIVMSKHLEETFEVITETERYQVKLEGGYKRWPGEANQMTKYVFTKEENDERPKQDRMDRCDVESGAGLHQDQPRLCPLLRGDVRGTVPRRAGPSLRARL